MYIGLLIGCYSIEDGTELEDRTPTSEDRRVQKGPYWHAGSVVLRTYPFLDCDEVASRWEMGLAGTIIFLAGIPAFIMVLLVLYHNRLFKSDSSYYLIRAIFSGHRWDRLSRFVDSSQTIARKLGSLRSSSQELQHGIFLPHLVSYPDSRICGHFDEWPRLCKAERCNHLFGDSNHPS